MSQLSDLVTPSAVRLDVRADDWRAAIRAAGALLESDGIATGDYTDAMIRIVEEYGPYIVIAPGFALAHARPDESVHRTGMSFVRLAEPVAFGNADNDPVRIVMALAAADASTHREALVALASLLVDPVRRPQLDDAPTPEAVCGVLAGDGDEHGTAAGSAVATERDTAAGSGATIGPGAAAGSDAEGDDPAGPGAAASSATAAHPAVGAPIQEEQVVPSKNLILTVCGNGLGTSLFLKNTAEQVLEGWGWSPYMTIEATDTISAKGKAKDADLVLTSGAIADALGDIGVPVEVIRDFTSQAEIDAALRRSYAV